jgi:hypothetical protein
MVRTSPSIWDERFANNPLVPSSVDFGNAVAFAYVNSALSVYKDISASYLMVMVHEGQYQALHRLFAPSHLFDPILPVLRRWGNFFLQSSWSRLVRLPSLISGP